MGGTDRHEQLRVEQHGKNWSSRLYPAVKAWRPRDKSFKVTLGPRTEQNPFSGELADVRHALRLVRKVRHRRIVLATSNKAAVLTLKDLH